MKSKTEKTEKPVFESGKDFYNVKEAAKLLDVTEMKVRELLRSGDLKGFKKLRKWYIFHTDIVNFIKS